MSADLFAAFETPPADSSSQKPKSQPGGVTSLSSPSQDDPFSFLTTTTSPAGTGFQPQPFQWQPVTTTQRDSSASLWPTVASPAPSSGPQNSSVWGDLGGLGNFQSSAAQTQQQSVREEEDDWGDFEAPEGPSQVPTGPTTIQEPVRNRVVRASTIDMLSNKLVDLDTTWGAPKPKDARLTPARTRDPNVLFDASDFELGEVEGEDDEFGDFEAEQPVQVLPTLSSSPSFGTDVSSFGATQPKKQPPNLLLADTTSSSNASLYPQAPKSPYGSFHIRKPDPMKELKVKTPQTAEFPQEVKQEEESPVTAWPDGKTDYFDSEWAEFKDVPADTKPTSKPATTGANEMSGKPDALKSKPVIDSSLLTDTTAVGPPPTNIPPPSVLLSIFPQLLDVASTSLLKPVSTLPASDQQLIAANEATRLFLMGYLALATVAARIIAGRKVRWHRDKFLMQGMTISAAGGKGGMKLAGIDKTQSARDDREATEVINVWKAQVGRLRSAVAAANTAAAGTNPLKVPELSLHVSAHAAPNVVTAPKPCAVCGLKRDERIAKVDFDVEDSFGEWWVEFWGHRACRNFWLQHEAKLRQR
ncbi:hypothetical protein QBC37DRAFT_413706 [Rhypophila decipiens]|uniref:Uncharacterized protein n=1 Tax=Rhypophila decipiens TaxID=261697 RepID=A0AAN7BBT2_9PEZI|nr:hypothetical protein QBC37DRAFT_413706 [Rhypophila decipiens]